MILFIMLNNKTTYYPDIPEEHKVFNFKECNFQMFVFAYLHICDHMKKFFMNC